MKHLRSLLSLPARAALAVWRDVDGQRPPPPAPAGKDVPMTDDLTTETPAESRAALRAEVARLRVERDEARAGEARLIRAITGGQPAELARLRAICEAEVLRRAAAERDALRAELARLRATLLDRTTK